MLQVGDLVLYPVGPTSRWSSKLVAWGQRLIGQNPTVGKNYSHVALVGPDTLHIYEAYWPKIRQSDIQLTGVEFYRIKGITPGQVAEMVGYCQERLGEWYDMVAIVTFGFLQLGKAEVCSELVYSAALCAGVVLYPPAYFESPDDIAASALLEPVLP